MVMPLDPPSFEKTVDEALTTLKGCHPEKIEIERFPRVELQNGEILIPDFSLIVRFQHEDSYYFVECQDRKKNSKALLHKIQYFRAKHWRKTFIFTYPESVSAETLRAMKNEGIICCSLVELATILHGISCTLSGLDASKAKSPFMIRYAFICSMYENSRKTLALKRPSVDRGMLSSR